MVVVLTHTLKFLFSQSFEYNLKGVIWRRLLGFLFFHIFLFLYFLQISGLGPIYVS